MPAHEFGGDWTEQKLRVLDNYLVAYCRIFQKNPGARHLETIYIDAFAETGIIQRKVKPGNEEELFTEFAQPEFNFCTEVRLGHGWRYCRKARHH